MTPMGHHQKINYTLYLNTFSATSFIFDLKVSLDRVHQDLNFCLWGNLSKRVRTRRTKKRNLRQISWFLDEIQFLLDILSNTTIFLVKFFCKKNLWQHWRKAYFYQTLIHSVLSYIKFHFEILMVCQICNFGNCDAPNFHKLYSG